MSSPGFEVPPGAVDCHLHVFDPQRFPYSPTRRYTPSAATVADLRRFHAEIGVPRTVFVQPSVYATDNRCLLDGLKQLGKDARGIAVIDRTFSAQQLDDFAAAGVRGVRINLETGKGRDLDEAARRLCDAAQQIEGRGWAIQLWTALPVIAGLEARITEQPNEIIIDHFGLAKVAGGVEQEGFSVLLSLMKAGKAYVKLSGPYMISQRADYSDITPIAKTLIEAAPERVIWGSNWPHTSGSTRKPDAKPTDVEPFRKEDDGYNLGLVKSWAADASLRRRLLAANPARLFGFSG
ncbi:MAG: amidohydrolase family protein [Candidatus Korobacteraceae bacterium]|jgi:predicted TIM-barrel fold metal-dependent hydrolase